MLFSEFLESTALIGFKGEMEKAILKQIELSFDIACVEKANRSLYYSLNNMRERSPLSQRRAARFLKIPQAKLSRLENGSRLPSKKLLKEAIELYEVNEKEFSSSMEKAIRDGSITIPPIYALAHKGFTCQSNKDTELLWELTQIQWRNQAGIPISFREARKVTGVRELCYTNNTRITKQEQQRLERLHMKAIYAHHIFYMCIVYRVSPLSLVNGILLATLHKSNTILGGTTEVFKGYDDKRRPIMKAGANEELFMEIKRLITEMNLIPKWQLPLWDSIMLSVLSSHTLEAKGVNKYLPFPLTPKNYNEWINDPILQLYEPDEPPTSDFFYNLDLELPHDQLKPVDENTFDYYLIGNPKNCDHWIDHIMSDYG